MVTGIDQEPIGGDQTHYVELSERLAALEKVSEERHKAVLREFDQVKQQNVRAHERISDIKATVQELTKDVHAEKEARQMQDARLSHVEATQAEQSEAMEILYWLRQRFARRQIAKYIGYMTTAFVLANVILEFLDRIF